MSRASIEERDLRAWVPSAMVPHMLSPTPKHLGQRARALLLALSALLLLSGCTGSSPDAAGSPAPRPSPPAQGRSMTFALAGYASQTAELPAEPIGTVASAEPGLTLEVYLLERTEKAVLVVFALNVDGTEGASTSTFEMGEDSNDTSVGAVSLVDTAGLKQYLTLRPARVKDDGFTGCACTDSGSRYGGEPGERIYLAALVTAPPPSVSTVSFVTPIGSIADLPIKA
ncbi:MAG: hypothetical protein ACR2K2_03630 [Mycobacteriales bacterium]